MTSKAQKTILFIDDQPYVVARFTLALERANLATRTLKSIAEVGTFLEEDTDPPGCILVDLRFPCDTGIPLALTQRGMRAGQSLIPPLQNRYPTTPIVIFSAEPFEVLSEIKKFHTKCHILNKDEANRSIEQFISFIRALAEDEASRLMGMLETCEPGPRHGKQFEQFCIDTLRFLFIPPQKEVLAQSARGDRSDIRDAVIPNIAERGFWNQVRHAYDAKQIVVEFKNLTSPFDKDAVQQLAGYLTKSTGRLGILISRCGPNTAARKAQRKALTEEQKLILFLNDTHLKNMCKSRQDGEEPTDALYALKNQLELD